MGSHTQEISQARKYLVVLGYHISVIYQLYTVALLIIDPLGPIICWETTWDRSADYFFHEWSTQVVEYVAPQRAATVSVFVHWQSA
jgi:hypothetical protein